MTNRNHQNHSKKVIKLKPLYLAMASIFSSFADAGAIIPDNREHNAPTMNQSANGTPVINIVDPNASGVSHNKFSEFNVDQQGVVFNNSMTDGASQIGGFVIKNNQLTHESKAIISEVTGTKGTQINGAMEVFGQKADVIIANQNGISVNGVSTVNANNLTLTTGKINAQADGRIQLSVEKGTVNVQGKGISTEGLGYFDIISRSAVLEGEIAGQADIKVVTGLNEYDIQSRTHTVRDANASDRPEVSIDGSALGSMYGNRIQLISTESGAGVRHEGSVVGKNGIEISANGDLRLSGLKSEQGGVTLAGNNISVQKNSAGQGGIISQLDLVINALGHIDLGADAVSQQGRILIDASSMLQNAATLMAENGQAAAVNVPSIQINIANEYQITGSLYAVDQSGQQISDAVISLENGDYVVRRNGQVIDAGVASNAQVVSASGDIALNAKSAKNNNGGIFAQKGALVLNIDEAFENNGMLNASGKLSINTRAFKNKGIVFTDSQLINANSFENAGGLYAQNKIDVTSDSLINSGKMSSTGSDIQLNVNGETARNSGNISAKNVTINQKNQANKSAAFINEGRIDSEEKLHINSDSVSNSGTLIAGTAVELALTKELKNTGSAAEIIAEQDLLIYSNLTDNALSVFNESGWVQGNNLHLSDIDTYSNTAGATLIANESIELSNINNIFNDDSLIKADSVLLSHIQNLSNTQNSIIEGTNNLVISDINKLINDKSTLQSDGDVSISNITEMNNINGLISSGGTLDIRQVEHFLNTAVATIQASTALLINSVTSLENSDGSIILSQDVMNMDAVKNILNDETSQVISETELTISNADLIDNAGVIQSNSNLSIKDVNTLLNSGETSLIAALDNLTIENIATLSNTEKAIISSGLELVLNSIETLINNAAVIQSEDGMTVNAANLTNLGGNIQSYGNIALNITHVLENLSVAGVDIYGNPVSSGGNLLADGTLDIHAETLVNQSEINATNILIDAKDVINTGGNIEGYETAALKVANEFVNKDGSVRGNDRMSLDLDKDFVFDENAGSLMTLEELSIHSDGNISIRDSLESMGDIILDADKDITNYSSIVSNQNITLDGKNITNAFNADTVDSDGNPVPAMSSLIWAFGDVKIDARDGTFHNQKYGNVLSVGDMSIIAKEIINDAGIIRSEGDMALDARSIKNLSEYSGGDWKTGPIQEGSGATEGWIHLATYESWTVWTYLPTLSSDITLLTKAEISSAGKMDINQKGIYENTESNRVEVLNEGGIIQSVGDMTITGNLTNAPKYTKASLYEYVTEPLATPIKVQYYWTTGMDHWDTATFNTFYTYLDWMFGDGRPSHQEGDEFSKSDFLNSLRKAAAGTDNSSPQLNTVMTMIFGESWLTKSLGTLRDDWVNLGKSSDNTDIGTDGALKEKGFYFLPNDKGSIVTMGNFNHNGGELNNGIGDFTIETGSSSSVNVEKVGDQEIAPIGGSTEVLINIKDIEEYRAGISPMSTIEAMSKLPAMFPYSPEWNQRNTGEPNLKDGPTNTVTPVFETRFEMIDQSQYFGSDYFFEQVGYVPDEPVYVIGDNYYISELIRRQINDSVGTYFAVRDGVDGVDLVKMLMDNAMEVVNYGIDDTGGAEASDGMSSSVADSSDSNNIPGQMLSGTSATSMSSASSAMSSTSSNNIPGQTLSGDTVTNMSSASSAMSSTSSNNIPGQTLSGDTVTNMSSASSAMSSTGSNNIPGQTLSGGTATDMSSASSAMSSTGSNNIPGQTLSGGTATDMSSTSSAMSSTSSNNIPGQTLSGGTATDMSSTSSVMGSTSSDNIPGQMLSGDATPALSSETSGTAGTNNLSGQTSDTASTATTAVKSNSTKENLGLVVGEPLTEEQRSKLDKDIVWFVNQTIDGEQVLVPFVYLANTTIEAMSTGAKESSGSAVIHAKEDVNIDASSVNNKNALISAGNNANITAEGDINNSSKGASGGIVAKKDVSLVSTEGSIKSDGAYVKAGNDINMAAENGSIVMTASVGRDEEGKQQVHTYDDAVSAGGNITMKAKDITSNAAIIEAGNDVNMTSTEGDITFNEMHEVSAEYSNELEGKGPLNFTHTETETTTAKAIEGKVTAGGNLNIDSAKDVVMKGGEYSGTSGSIKAAGEVDMQATQDYEHSESVVESREFTLTGNANAMGYSASAEYSGLDGMSSKTTAGDYEFDYGSEFGGKGSKNPGKAAVAPAATSFVGFRSSTDTSTSDSVTNQNASFNFSKDLNIEAKTVDIGGADIKTGNELNITADELKTTKYVDTVDETFTHEGLSVGLTASAASVFLDVADKNAGMVVKAANNPDVGFDALTTAAQVAGDVTNLIFNDFGSYNHTWGVDYNKSSGSSSSTSENITHVDAGKVNIKTKGDTTLNGVDMKAKDVVIDAGGDVNMRAAEQTTSYTENGMNVSVGVTLGGAVDRDSAGVGLSLDASGGKNQKDENSKSYTNTTVVADNVSIKSGNDINLVGADVTAKTADVKAAGDLNIVSVQDTVDNDASSWHAGASVGVAVTTDSAGLPMATGSVNAGGGSDFLDSATTAKQSGIHTSGELNVETGGDLNMTGGQLISDDHTGNVDVAGNINVKDLVDTVEQDGAYGGGGGGVTKTGPSVNMYTQTTDEIHYQENQHSTIDVGNTTASKINGDLNTDGTKTSDVVKDEKEWGSDISATVSYSAKNKSKGGKAVDGNTPNTTDGGATPRPDGMTPKDHGTEPAKKPEPAPKPEPTPEPAPTPKPEPTPEPAPTPKPEPTPEPAPTPKPEPEPAPTPKDKDKDEVPSDKDKLPEPSDKDEGKTPDDQEPSDKDKLPEPSDKDEGNTPKDDSSKTEGDDTRKQDESTQKEGDETKPTPDAGKDTTDGGGTPAKPVDGDDGKTPEKPRPSEYNGKKWAKVETPKRVVTTPGSATGNTTWIEPPKSGPGKDGTQYQGVPRSGAVKTRDTAPKTPAADGKKVDPSKYDLKKYPVVQPAKPVVLTPGSNTNNITPNDTPRDGNKNNGTEYEGMPVRKEVKLPDSSANWKPLMPEHVMASAHTYQETEWSESNTPINQRGTKNA